MFNKCARIRAELKVEVLVTAAINRDWSGYVVRMPSDIIRDDKNMMTRVGKGMPVDRGFGTVLKRRRRREI